MAPKYRLTYFPVKALAEPIRYVLAYGGVDFEDIRIDVTKWPEMKSTMPYGKLPILEVGDRKMSQSVPICRHFAKQFGLMGTSDDDALEIDIAVDALCDFRQICSDYFRMVFMNRPEDKDQAAKRKGEILADTAPFYLARFEKVVGDNKGFLVGGKLTWADLFFTAMADSMSGPLGSNILDPYPKLKALTVKVMGLPTIKTWLDKRPVTNY